MKAILPLIIVLGLLSVVLLIVLIVLVVYFYCLVRSDRKRDLRYPRSSCEQSRDTGDSLINGDQQFQQAHPPHEHPPHEHSQIRFTSDTASFSTGRHVTIANDLAPPNGGPSPRPQQKSILKKQVRTDEELMQEEKERLNLKLVDLPPLTKKPTQENYSPRVEQKVSSITSSPLNLPGTGVSVPPVQEVDDDACDYEDIENATRGQCYKPPLSGQPRFPTDSTDIRSTITYYDSQPMSYANRSAATAALENQSNVTNPARCRFDGQQPGVTGQPILESQQSMTNRPIFESQVSRARSDSLASRSRLDSTGSESRPKFGKASPSLDRDNNVDDVYTKVVRRPSRDPIVVAMKSLGMDTEESLFIE